MLTDKNDISYNYGNLIEIFSSIQGEAAYCGYRQLFIRFSGCNLRCDFCDTKQSAKLPEKFKVEDIPGGGFSKTFPNPVSAESLLKIIGGFDQSPYHSIALTGGEPLMQTSFLLNILPELKKRGKKIFLETNGTLADSLSEIIDLIDIVSMDMKIPSVSGLGELWNEHENFLNIAKSKEVFVKIVFDDKTGMEEMAKACRIISDISPKIPLILQPLTDPDGKIRIDMPKMFKIQDYAAGSIKSVRVIPQLHKCLKIL